ncbi:WXG100 family type VII secretion target [Paenibacillus lautus]
MSRILVTPEMLLHVAQQCSRAHEQLEAMIHMLNQNIHMLESAWEGTTRSRFYADFQQAHREMTQTTEHIHRTSLELRGIAQRFKSADERGQPIPVAGHVLGAFPMMRGPAGHSGVEDAGRKAEEAWNSVQQEAGKAWDTVKQEAGELWEGVKLGAAQFGNSLKDTAISLYEDPLGTGQEMLYNATIGTVEDIWDTAVWAGRMVFSNEYREKIVADTMNEVDSAGGWSNFLGQQSAMILGGAILNRAGIRGRGPLNNKHDDLGGGNGGPSYGKNSAPIGPYREVNGFPVKVKPGAQEKHIPDTPNYKQEIANGQNKSIFYGDNKTAQELLDKFAGKGTTVTKNKERVDFGKPIGKYYDPVTGQYVETYRGMIHYGKDGAHIVPAKPSE